MSITPQTIGHLAELTRLHLEETERVSLAEYLNSLQPTLDQLNTVDTDGVEPLVSVLDSKATPLRSDEARPSLPQDEALANAPDRYDAFFRVPPMIGADSDDQQ